MKPLIVLIFCCLELPFGGRVFWLMSNCRFFGVHSSADMDLRTGYAMCPWLLEKVLLSLVEALYPPLTRGLNRISIGESIWMEKGIQMLYLYSTEIILQAHPPFSNKVRS